MFRSLRTIFRVSVIWIVLLCAAYIYTRIWNVNPILRLYQGKLLTVLQEQQKTQTATEISGVSEQLNRIEQKIDALNGNENPTSTPVAMAPTKVLLYVFNQVEDRKLPPAQQVNTASLRPVERMVQGDLIVGALNVLIAGGGLTDEEKSQGFFSDFTNTGFRLVSSNLSADGILTLEFNDIPGFTSGGGARVGLMRAAIEKTVRQFPQVKQVIIKPDTILQP